MVSVQCFRRTWKLKKMRISIREQLGFLVLFTALISLMVLALATWFQNKSFITDIRLSGLSLTASLKAAQLAATLTLYQTQVKLVATRLIIQTALQRYNAGNQTDENWNRSISDLEGALGSGDILIQAVVFPGVSVGNATALSGLMNVTAANLNAEVELPYKYPNGSNVRLGDPGDGYPSTLYPTLTYGPNTTTTSADAFYEGRRLNPHEMLLLGPLVLNDSYTLLSGTTGIVNTTNPSQTLGWLTLVFDASMMYTIQNSREGLGKSGEVLIVGPDRSDNVFSPNPSEQSRSELVDQPMKFILPPINEHERHEERSSATNASVPFTMSSFPAVVAAWTRSNNQANNAGAFISTYNEDNDKISAGYALVNNTFVDWVLIAEQDYGEVVAPIRHLRDVVLICVFSVIGGLLLIMFPLAHYSITPIRQLRAATAKTVEPYLPEDGSEYASSSGHMDGPEDESPEPIDEKRHGFFANFMSAQSSTAKKQRRRRTFRIPGKVPERKHWVTDELTDLTSTFNEMSDELAMQYQRLEERVRERTAELERSKQAAEAANQSKTLFIANISHELKTPLNGILGLTTVCMNENDVGKIRSTLSTIYKSGDLLLHLLTDLLTFSKNEVGQQLAIDEAEFRICDLSTQLMPTFEKQAREGQIDLKVAFLGTSDTFGNTSDTSGEKLYGPSGTGRVRDMCLWGDKNRILQVLMNFVSNSLKFTPAHGSVTIRIRCTGIVDPTQYSRQGSLRKSSVTSRKSKNSSSKRVRMSDASIQQQSDSDVSDNEKKKGKHHTPPVQHHSKVDRESQLSINLAGGTAHIAKIVERRRSASPPPLNTKDLAFEFEVEDTGPGIPEDQQNKIFEPFVQGDLGLSKKYGGTGLGLSICAQLAALMGGSISLDSKVGRGSKFTMSIPLRYVSERSASTASSMNRSHSKASSLVGHTIHDPADHVTSTITRPPDQVSSTSSDVDVTPETLVDVPRIVGFTQPYVASETKPDSAKAKLKEMKKAESEAAKQGKKVRVLVAEDNPVNQEVVLRMLKLEDVYDVTIAKDGQEAFDKVRDSMRHPSQRFDLVFMDVQMPNVDGIQSTKLIREMGFRAPIVALTAFAEKSNEDECMASGMDYFLAKPIRRPALKQVLKKYAPIPEEEGEGSAAQVPRVSDLKAAAAPHHQRSPSRNSSPGRAYMNGSAVPGQHSKASDKATVNVSEAVDGEDVSPMTSPAVTRNG